MKKILLLLIITMFLFSCFREDVSHQHEHHESMEHLDIHTHTYHHSNEQSSLLMPTYTSLGTVFRCNYPKFLRYKKVYVKGVKAWNSRIVETQIKSVLNDLGSLTSITFVISDDESYDYTIELQPAGGACEGAARNYRDKNGIQRPFDSGYEIMGTLVQTGKNIKYESAEWIRSMFAHEIGHCLGFKHPNESGCSEYPYERKPVMAGAADCDATFYHVYNNAERNTLQYMYPITF